MADYTAIDDPSAYFQTKLYTGTNNELVLTFDGNSDLQPNMIWTKNRGRAANHVLSDTVRGIGKGLYPDLTNAEGDTNYILVKMVFGKTELTLKILLLSQELLVSHHQRLYQLVLTFLLWVTLLPIVLQRQ